MVAHPRLAISRQDFAAATNYKVANNLSLVADLVRGRASALGAATRAMGGDEVRLVLEELSGRVDTIARLHRLLSEAPPDVFLDLGGYLCDLARTVVSALSSAGEMELRFACEDRCRVSPDVARPLGLIVVELVTNAIKYAHPSGVKGAIEVACGRTPDGRIFVEVSDDGVGLPENFDPMKDGNGGLRLVRSLAAQLAADIDFTHSALGLSFELKMPVAASVGLEECHG